MFVDPQSMQKIVHKRDKKSSQNYGVDQAYVDQLPLWDNEVSIYRGCINVQDGEQPHLSKFLLLTILPSNSLQFFSLYCSHTSYNETSSCVHSMTALISTSLSASQPISF